MSNTELARQMFEPRMDSWLAISLSISPALTLIVMFAPLPNGSASECNFLQASTWSGGAVPASASRREAPNHPHPVDLAYYICSDLFEYAVDDQDLNHNINDPI